LDDAGVRLIVKREDLNHPSVSGNKWWKLKHNLLEAERLKKSTILTFGGAYSNHIYATAAACHEVGFKSIGIIRGEETLPTNSTLSFAKEKGMLIEYISREDYRRKTQKEFIDQLNQRYGDFFLIPEGGTNEFAVEGCEEMAQLFSATDFTYFILPAGTGGTITGLIRGLKGSKQIIGVSVLKGDFLQNEIENLLKKYPDQVYGNWSLLTSYHHGGYAKVTHELVEFMQAMRVEHHLPLDPVYTGKLLWATMEEVKRGSFQRGSTILALHTGGLQGGIMMAT
jgi:1-aminocyclopropane-1-carboxylate deaminase